MEIRRATIADTAGLASCFEAAYARYIDRIPDLPKVSEGIAEEIVNHQVWVVVEQNKIVAGLVLIQEEEFMKLANVAVRPDHGGEGIGSKLMNLAEEETKRQGMAELRLVTHTAMPENIAYYERFGWQETDRKDNSVLMRKIF